jgi:putative acetyltransferase
VEISIVEERPHDVAAIRRVNEKAFGQPQEADLVDLLRAHGSVLLSLVALRDAEVVGHILYSPVRLGTDPHEVQGAGLGPMAVLPELQRTGIGSKLVAEGTRRLRTSGCPIIVVLGHPEYYPRFGFVPASRHGVRCQWAVPDEVFMAMPLDESRLGAMRGLARYGDEFFSAL